MRDIHDLTTRVVADPALAVFIVLDGVVDFSVDDRPFIAAARRSRCSNADCSVLMRNEPAVVTRRGHKGERTRKVAVSVDSEQLEEMASGAGGPALAQFATSHLAYAAWRASPRLVALAEQILQPPQLNPFLADMHIESRCIEILAEALGTFADKAGGPIGTLLATRDVLKARAAREVSVTSLQRRFKSAYGTTVVEFLRARKLERARDALERGDMSIGEAAFHAGYTNAANFATAFRRAFGMPPRALRR